MNCGEFRTVGRDFLAGGWLNQAGRREAEHHAAACPECRDWLDGQRELNRALAACRAQSNSEPSAAVESAVMTAFQRHARGNRRHWQWLAVAAALAVVTIGLVWLRQTPQSSSVSARTTAGFIPVRYGAPVHAYETLQVLRVNLPRRELLRMGLPVGPEGPGGTVKADVLVGEDGLVKGIRFTSNTLEMQSKGVTQ